METFLYALRSFDGPLYYMTAILCIIFIMAIIGFLMERGIKQEEEEALKRAGAFDVNLTTDSSKTESKAAEEMMKPVTPGVIDFTEAVRESERAKKKITKEPQIEETPVATEESIPDIK